MCKSDKTEYELKKQACRDQLCGDYCDKENGIYAAGYSCPGQDKCEVCKKVNPI
jgi:hypothetical protein